MKKQRLTDKDYLRLSRTKGEESESVGDLKPAASGAKRRGQVTVRDQFASMGRLNRERILMRWSEKSVRSTRRANAQGSMGIKTVNKGKLQRDRGVTRKEMKADQAGSTAQKAGLYTRVALKNVKGMDMDTVESKLNARASVKRRGVGRKNDQNQILWFGGIESTQYQGMYRTEKDRYGLRTRLKRTRSQDRKGKTLVDNVKTYYNRSRMKLLRMQSRMRSNVRVSHEKARKQKNG